VVTRVGAGSRFGADLHLLSLLPALDMVRTGFPGPLEHFAAYAGSGAIAMAGYGLRPGGAWIIGLFWIYAGVLEYLQHVFCCAPLTPRKLLSSQETPRRRERDSNPRSPEPAVLRGLREVGCGALRKAPLEDTVRQRVGATAVPQLDLSCSACHSIEPGAQLVLLGVASPRSVSARSASAFCR
jgi:hypothetical protein